MKEPSKKIGNPHSARMLSVSVQQLRFAVAAADHGSIRQAAEFLSVRHSILSRSIRQLEHSIAVIIFERSGSGVKPTLAGQSVLRMARLILEQTRMGGARPADLRLVFAHLSPRAICERR